MIRFVSRTDHNGCSSTTSYSPFRVSVTVHDEGVSVPAPLVLKSVQSAGNMQIVAVHLLWSIIKTPLLIATQKFSCSISVAKTRSVCYNGIEVPTRRVTAGYKPSAKPALDSHPAGLLYNDTHRGVTFTDVTFQPVQLMAVFPGPSKGNSPVIYCSMVF